MSREMVRPEVIASASLLSSIEPSEWERLRPHVERAVQAQGTVLARAGERSPYLWFPDGGVVSSIVRLENGDAVEAALVGSEGLIGVEHFTGAPGSLLTAMVQVPGPVFRVPAEAVVPADFPSLTAAVLRYAGSLVVIVAQVAACNATHSLRQRMARWLLMAHDRAGRDRFRLTHEFIATMINVRRAGVSQFASELREAGAIAYTRGEVAVLDRGKLERESCECYRVIRRQSLGN